MGKPTKPEQRAQSKKEALLADLTVGVQTYVKHPVVAQSTELSIFYRDLIASPDSEYKQLYRALAGVPACILEGFGRGPNGYRTNFFLMARGSAYEALGHAMIVGSVHQEEILQLCEAIDILITGTLTDE